MLLAVNVDVLWKAAIRENFAARRPTFPSGKALDAMPASTSPTRAERAAIGGSLVGLPDRRAPARS